MTDRVSTSCSPRENEVEASLAMLRDVGSVTTGPLPSHTPSVRESPQSNAFHVMARYKTIINEIVQALEESPHPTPSVEDYIAVTEDALRALKTVRVSRRTDVRRSVLSRFAAGRSPHKDHSPVLDGQLSPLSDTHSSTAGATSANTTLLTAITEGALDGSMNGAPDANSAVVKMVASRSYLSALVKQKKVSPKRSTDELPHGKINRELVEAARTTSALRSEERQRLAQERRDGHLREMMMKLEVAHERGNKVKMRRELAEERMRLGAQERADNGTRRAEEARTQTRERAQRGNSRVEEVLLTKDLIDQNKALKLDRKMCEVEFNQEQKREEQQKLASERNEAMNAAAERRRNMSQEKVERHQQREQQRLDTIKRAEEQRKAESELKQQRTEEREKKVQEHQLATSAETEALGRRVEERIQQSAQIREENREKMRLRLEKQELKQKEAKERREKDVEQRAMFHSAMSVVPAADEEAATQRLAKSVAALSRQGKNYLDTYQKESVLGAKELNRSKLRPLFARMNGYSSSTPVLGRQPLSDLRTIDLTDVDHEFVRHFNAYETVVHILQDARRDRDLTTASLCCDVLHRLFDDEDEGRSHVMQFARCGNATALVVCVREEIMGLKKHNSSPTLCAVLSVLTTCFEVLTGDTAGASKVTSCRDHLVVDVEVSGVDRYCIAILRTCSETVDMEVLHLASRLLQAQVVSYSKRKSGETKGLWLQHVVTSSFTFLQNVLTPCGKPLTANDSLSPQCVSVLWSVFRLLNCTARWRLDDVQLVVADGNSPASSPLNPSGMDTATGGVPESDSATTAAATYTVTRMEAFHVFYGFVQCVCARADEWETIPSEEPRETATPSFADALRFGVTRSSMPPVRATKNGGGHNSTRSSMVPSLIAEITECPLRCAVHEFLLLIGYLTACNQRMQETFTWGTGKTLLSLLLSLLPIPYFTAARHVLMPTLLCILFRNQTGVERAAEDMDVTQLHAFLQDEFDRLSRKVQQQAMQIHAVRDTEIAQQERQKSKCWADMVDGDDNDTIASYLERTASISRDSSGAVDRERLGKVLKGQLLSQSSYFRVDRRFPVSVWVDMLQQLQPTNHVDPAGQPQ